MDHKPNDWLEKDMHREAVQRMKSGDPELSLQWMSIVLNRLAMQTRANADQLLAAFRDMRDDEPPANDDSDL